MVRRANHSSSGMALRANARNGSRGLRGVDFLQAGPGRVSLSSDAKVPPVARSGSGSREPRVQVQVQGQAEVSVRASRLSSARAGTGRRGRQVSAGSGKTVPLEPGLGPRRASASLTPNARRGIIRRGHRASLLAVQKSLGPSPAALPGNRLARSRAGSRRSRLEPGPVGHRPALRRNASTSARMRTHEPGTPSDCH
jgi:hypothetical protein